MRAKQARECRRLLLHGFLQRALHIAGKTLADVAYDLSAQHLKFGLQPSTECKAGVDSSAGASFRTTKDGTHIIVCRSKRAGLTKQANLVSLDLRQRLLQRHL